MPGAQRLTDRFESVCSESGQDVHVLLVISLRFCLKAATQSSTVVPRSRRVKRATSKRSWICWSDSCVSMSARNFRPPSLIGGSSSEPVIDFGRLPVQPFLSFQIDMLDQAFRFTAPGSSL